MKELFLFLSSTKTHVSKTVRFFTRSKTTHSALCLNDKFDCMYSFGRKTLKLFPAGLVHENIRENMLRVQNSCYCEVYRLKISDESYQNLLKEISTQFGSTDARASRTPPPSKELTVQERFT